MTTRPRKSPNMSDKLASALLHIKRGVEVEGDDMTGKQDVHPIARGDRLEEYYTVLQQSFNAMRLAFNEKCLSQDQIAARLGVDKGLISKRLKGQENLTLKTLSFMATAMDCRLQINFIPYDEIAPSQGDSAQVALGKRELEPK